MNKFIGPCIYLPFTSAFVASNELGYESFPVTCINPSGQCSEDQAFEIFQGSQTIMVINCTEHIYQANVRLHAVSAATGIMPSCRLITPTENTMWPIVTNASESHTPTASTAETSEAIYLSNGETAGVIVGVILSVFAVLLVIVCCWRTCRTRAINAKTPALPSKAADQETQTESPPVANQDYGSVYVEPIYAEPSDVVDPIDRYEVNGALYTKIKKYKIR